MRVYKFSKLFGNQYIGFWLFGLVLFAVQEIPYMIKPFIKLKKDPLTTMNESSNVLNIFEKIFGSLCIALMIFIVHNDSTFFSIKTSKEKIFFTITLIILLLNFIGWIIYFWFSQSDIIILLFIVAMPPLFYMFIGFWRNNILLIITSAIFFVIHFTHVLLNLKKTN
ncbi:hypothetical protein BCR32DRAFT_128709 [Anaeromyces robustus]|uniref:Uncharacterized protein n=1 Tax=Anaeromyces robustus TaxID=1754192 RepID=A0A1Y1VSZ9_9FUNG|nr:hypothetical protein BCR32DRAFT_128709 [Anaeromyces robustus]|eukprot:ORX64432.1 hypothetical protein BCR32DRAFT_128709 [Anaeromyces robustus]